jgi:hypothetical protein
MVCTYHQIPVFYSKIPFSDRPNLYKNTNL